MSEPRRSVRSLARRWWPVVLAVPLGAAAGAGYAVVAHPSYAANSYVIVVPENQGESATAINFAQAYGRLAGQPQVLAAAAAETGHSRAELEVLVHGTTSPDAPMIEITGTGARPPEAVRAADAVARSLVAFANTSSKETGVRLVPLAAAAEPDKPTTPSAQLDVAVGAAAGVLIGALVMMTRRRGTEPVPAAAASGSGPAPTTPRPRTEEAPARAADAPAEPAPAEQPATGKAPAEKAAAGKTAAEKTPTKEKSAAGSGR
ncbi:Wzz/FepE/Etk N-terminal domain-containing protein [Kitasatospora sp. NPDC058218]|uniref:Wzz/FepE/Etk N-terminal domain-containing protein n=1 Tax=Kitasatospora sp. NPDC058218 TaxID=3346385 RepID=UPI0036DF2652